MICRCIECDTNILHRNKKRQTGGEEKELALVCGERVKSCQTLRAQWKKKAAKICKQFLQCFTSVAFKRVAHHWYHWLGLLAFHLTHTHTHIYSGPELLCVRTWSLKIAVIYIRWFKYPRLLISQLWGWFTSPCGDRECSSIQADPVCVCYRWSADYRVEDQVRGISRLLLSQIRQSSFAMQFIWASTLPSDDRTLCHTNKEINSALNQNM